MANKTGQPKIIKKRVFGNKQAVTIFLFLLPAIVFVSIFVYYPMLQGGTMAFQKYTLLDLKDTPWIGFDNFTQVMSDPNFGKVIKNTLVWVIGSLIPQFVIGFMLALWLKNKFRFRGLYQAFIFFPWAISGFLIGLLFRWILNSEFGVVNDLLKRIGIISEPIPWLSDPDLAMLSVIIANIWYGVTFFTIMILAALQSVPDELYEAAAIDGANKFRMFWNITVPTIQTTLMLIVLLRIIWIVNFPDIIYAMTAGGPANQTHIISSWMINYVQQGEYGLASAIALIMVSFLVLFSIFYLLSMRDSKEKK